MGVKDPNKQNIFLKRHFPSESTDNSVSLGSFETLEEASLYIEDKQLYPTWSIQATDGTPDFDLSTGANYWECIDSAGTWDLLD